MAAGTEHKKLEGNVKCGIELVWCSRSLSVTGPNWLLHSILYWQYKQMIFISLCISLKELYSYSTECCHLFTVCDDFKHQ
jgi:hypothetical protein